MTGVETQLPKLQYQMLKTRVVKKRDEADKEKIGFIRLLLWHVRSVMRAYAKGNTDAVANFAVTKFALTNLSRQWADQRNKRAVCFSWATRPNLWNVTAYSGL